MAFYTNIWFWVLLIAIIILIAGLIFFAMRNRSLATPTWIMVLIGLGVVVTIIALILLLITENERKEVAVITTTAAAVTTTPIAEVCPAPTQPQFVWTQVPVQQVASPVMAGGCPTGACPLMRPTTSGVVYSSTGTVPTYTAVAAPTVQTVSTQPQFFSSQPLQGPLMPTPGGTQPPIVPVRSTLTPIAINV